MRFHHPSFTPPKVAAIAIAINVGASAPLAAVAAKVKVPALQPERLMLLEQLQPLPELSPLSTSHPIDRLAWALVSIADLLDLLCQIH